MTAERRARGILRLTPLLAALGAGLSAAEPPAPAWTLEAPDWELTEYLRIMQARSGFVLTTAEGWTLLGDAVRWDLTAGSLYAHGRIVLAIPGGEDPLRGEATPALRIEAAAIGLQRGADGRIERGEAWDVRVFLGGGPRPRRLRCEHAVFTPAAITFTGLRGDAGHGGFLGLAVGRLVVGLREQTAPDRRGFERVVADLTLWHPRATIAGIPVVYSPVLYRDYRLDYPWTRYRFGDSDRQGRWLRAWIGSDLPPLAGWHSRLRLRGDRYTRVGTAYGVRGTWQHEDHGAGQALYYAFDEETVRRDQDPALGERSAHVLDLAQRLRWRGGALAARWVELPAVDPGTAFDERFRADFLEDDLDHRPQARRGLSAVHSWPLASVHLRSDRPSLGAPAAAELRGGVGLSVPSVTIVGPLGASALATAQRWEHPGRDDRADRLRYAAGLQVDQWFAASLGLSAEAGIDGLGYADPERAGSERDDAHRWVPQVATTARWQVVGRFGALSHRFTPALGFSWRGEGEGDPLPDFAFDGDDRLVEDLALFRLGFDTAVDRGTTLLRLRVTSDWALREQDLPRGRSEADDLGQRLRLVEVELASQPTAAFSARLRGDWNGEQRRWSLFDATFDWVPHPRFEIGGTATWQVDRDAWQYRPEATLVGGRYLLTTGLVFDDGEIAEARRFDLTLTRRSVDGDFGLTYVLERDADGAILDQSIGFTFSLDALGL